MRKLAVLFFVITHQFLMYVMSIGLKVVVSP